MSWRDRWSRRRRGSSPAGAGLPCAEVVEIVTDYLEGALSPHERARFEAHIAGCDGCRAYLEQIRTTIRASGRLSEESMPAEVRERFRQAFREWTASPR
jgi:anti-sigma factor RsiW